jgi:hypothetical protein
MPGDKVCKLALRYEVVAINVNGRPQLLQLRNVQAHELVLHIEQQLQPRAVLVRFLDDLPQLHSGRLERARRHKASALLRGKAAQWCHHRFTGNIGDTSVQKKLGEGVG